MFDRYARSAKGVDHEPSERILADAADHCRLAPDAYQIDGHVSRTAADTQMRPRREEQFTGLGQVRNRVADVIGDHDSQAQAVEERNLFSHDQRM